ncbi:hypothetical protein TNCT_373631 [Trichonephila clavata]|uniref:C2H2-type domain-containing protein n=1 Tax=Trichonephila clavata TaxID=2740835 RepID=A0A8X6HL37_TRICU|nr:hypothetical protein TNCT_373631 [Trichonephila clavata]
MGTPVDKLEDTRNLSDEMDATPQELKPIIHRFGNKYCKICKEIFLSVTAFEHHMNTNHQSGANSCPDPNSMSFTRINQSNCPETSLTAPFDRAVRPAIAEVKNNESRRMPRRTFFQQSENYHSHVATALLGEMPPTDQSARENLDAMIHRISKVTFFEMINFMNMQSLNSISEKKETDAVKEEKKLMKHFQKIVPLYIQKKQDHLCHLNEMEKKLVDIVKDEKKLLKVIRTLKCDDRLDVRKLIKHFGMDIRFLP